MLIRMRNFGRKSESKCRDKLERKLRTTVVLHTHCTNTLMAMTRAAWWRPLPVSEGAAPRVGEPAVDAVHEGGRRAGRAVPRGRRPEAGLQPARRLHGQARP
jgi:hypothetical protein